MGPHGRHGTAHLGGRGALLGLLTVLTVVSGIAPAEAVVVDQVPTWPIPYPLPAGPPPIATLPAATPQAPPSEAIADPVTPGAQCGGWHLQTSYGDRWATTSMWWEYSCTRHVKTYHNTCAGPMCDAFCPTCSWTWEDSADHFAWNGSEAVFYGQAYSEWFAFDSGYDTSGTFSWWDGPTSRWYEISNAPPSSDHHPIASLTAECTDLACDFDGSGSFDPDGEIWAYTWDFGDGATQSYVPSNEAWHRYEAAGTYPVTLTVTDYEGAMASATLIVSIPELPPPPPPNQRPVASYAIACTGSSCSFDGSASRDPDGRIVGYAWTFGDGGSGTGVLRSHTFPGWGTYEVVLTVTDDGGATGTRSKAVTTIDLAAQGFKVKGLSRTDLSWISTGAASYDVFLDGARIATVPSAFFIDELGRRRGAFAYAVCETGSAICSQTRTITI